MDFILDIHTHTIASGHAYSTIQENIREAKNKGLKLLGISDHSSSMPGSQHIYFFHNLRVIPSIIDDIQILKGVELNIIDYNGHIDMNNDSLDELDYAIASLHTPCIKYGTKNENTSAVINAIKNKYVNIIGHPDDSRYPLFYEEVVKAAVDNNVLLEINNSSLNPTSFRKDSKKNAIEILELCEKYNHPVIFGSDAHISYDVGNFKNCKNTIEELDFPKELIINSSIEKLFKFIK